MEEFSGNGVVSLWEDANEISRLSEHLIGKHGCRQPVFVIATPHNHFHRSRKLMAAQRPFFEVDPSLARDSSRVMVVSDYSYSEGVRIAEQLESRQDVDAAICMNDDIAVVIQRSFLTQMRHICVTGYDNTPAAEYFGITSVDVDRRSLALRVFYGVVNGSVVSPSEVEIIPSRTRFRQSCCAL